MSTERYFRFWSEVANAPSTVNRGSEGGLGEADLPSDVAHGRLVGQLPLNHHASGIASGFAVRKGRDPLHSQFSIHRHQGFPSSSANTLPCCEDARACDYMIRISRRRTVTPYGGHSPFRCRLPRFGSSQRWENASVSAASM